MADLVPTTPYRDLTVAEVARVARTSPATFYQYFPDVEAAVVELAEDVADAGAARLVAQVRRTAWHGPDGYAGVLALVDEILAFWDEHQAVLRIIDLATAEGNHRFSEVRNRLIGELAAGLAAAVRVAQSAGQVPADVSARSVAGVVAAMLAHVAGHRLGAELWGVRTADLRTTMARTLYWSVTGRHVSPPPPRRSSRR
ncbi:MAG: TetR/AcrR family transcriptional regulator [Actinobacteria bacterium]|nr:TetR/AcrR family transcriptional regulator [Actinomycetota bacterium]